MNNNRPNFVLVVTHELTYPTLEFRKVERNDLFVSRHRKSDVVAKSLSTSREESKMKIVRVRHRI